MAANFTSEGLQKHTKIGSKSSDAFLYSKPQNLRQTSQEVL